MATKTEKEVEKEIDRAMTIAAALIASGTYKPRWDMAKGWVDETVPRPKYDDNDGPLYELATCAHSMAQTLEEIIKGYVR